MKVYLAYTDTGFENTGENATNWWDIEFGDKVYSFNFNYDTKTFIYSSGKYEAYNAHLAAPEDIGEIIRSIFNANRISKG
jgi:hypothetical protein